jgi:hypothetical protein
MNKPIRYPFFLILALVLSASGYLADRAMARSQPAFMGAARYGADAVCFHEAYGGPVQSGCAAAKRWLIPLVWDKPGLISTIRVTARGAGNGTKNVSCRPYSVSATGAFTSGGSKSTVLNTGGLENLDMTMSLPSWGAVFVACTLDQGTSLIHVNYL